MLPKEKVGSGVSFVGPKEKVGMGGLSSEGDGSSFAVGSRRLLQGNSGVQLMLLLSSSVLFLVASRFSLLVTSASDSSRLWSVLVGGTVKSTMAGLDAKPRGPLSPGNGRIGGPVVLLLRLDEGLRRDGKWAKYLSTLPHSNKVL